MHSSSLSLVIEAIIYFPADMVVCSQQVLRKLNIVLQEKEESNDAPPRIM